MGFRLVFLFALLFDWRLMHSMPEPWANSDALAWCHWNGQMNALAEAVSNSSQTCASLFAAQYDRPNELHVIASEAVAWFDQSARWWLTAGS